jgi:asparagine synthase (glutamine-hydrolysing)
MCGIGVIFSKEGENLNNQAEDLRANLLHRGPDGFGVSELTVKNKGKITLVHTRLAIIDPNKKSDQPMTDKNGNVIIFNGEIYNFKEIRSELKELGEVFDTASDTEVLLKMYSCFGLDVLLKRVRGMFAFVIWDNDLQKLILARDPIGIKPMYYSTKGRFSCASEASSLVRAGVVGDKISQKGLDSFLAFGSVIEPLTIWDDVQALAPGSYLIVDSTGKVERSQLYWNWKVSKVEPDIKKLFTDSIDRNLVSDVPVSIFLSGGYDSTAIAAIAALRSNKKLHTFTISFPNNDSYSEGGKAKLISDRLGTIHHDIAITSSETLEQLPDFFESMDQPSDDGLNSYLVSKAVSKLNIKVALHGVGGDELFGGYPSFSDLPKLKWLSLIPKWVRNISSNLIYGNSTACRKISEVLHGNNSLLVNFLIRRSLFSYKQRCDILGVTPPMGVNGVPKNWFKNTERLIQGSRDVFTSISKLELSLYSVNKLLRDGDIMSMSHGLEVRFPMLDVDFISGVRGISSRKKQSKKEGLKPDLTKLVENFPHDLMSQKKFGFTLPLDFWLRNELKSECKLVLASLPSKMGFQSEAIDKIWENFENSTGGQEWVRVWQLYSLSKWYDCHANYKNKEGLF